MDFDLFRIRSSLGRTVGEGERTFLLPSSRSTTVCRVWDRWESLWNTLCSPSLIRFDFPSDGPIGPISVDRLGVELSSGTIGTGSQEVASK